MGRGSVFGVDRGRSDPAALQRCVDLLLDHLRHPPHDPDGSSGLPPRDVVDLGALTGLPPVRLAALPDAGDLLDLDLSWIEVRVLMTAVVPGGAGRPGPWRPDRGGRAGGSDPVLFSVTAPALGGGLTLDGARAFLDHVVLPGLRALLGPHCVGRATVRIPRPARPDLRSVVGSGPVRKGAVCRPAALALKPVR